LALSGDDSTLYVGGFFSNAWGGETTKTARSNLAAFRTTAAVGSELTSWSGATNSFVNTLALSSAGTLYAGGSFTQAGSEGRPTTARANLAAFNALSTTGSELITTWNGATNNTVSSLLLSSDNSTLYAGGQFTQAGSGGTANTAALSLASFNATTTTGNELNTTWTGATNGSISALALSPNGTKLYAGGAFNKAGSGGVMNSFRLYLAAFATTDGALQGP
jgi:hypothetical protein